MTRRNALIVGVTGIAGYNTATALLEEGWTVTGLSRTVANPIPGVTHVQADVLDPESIRSALDDLDIIDDHGEPQRHARPHRERVLRSNEHAALRDVADILGDVILDHVELAVDLHTHVLALMWAALLRCTLVAHRWLS